MKKQMKKKINQGVNGKIYGKILMFPESVSEAFSLGEKPTLPLRYYKKYSRIAILGMGGSGYGAGLLQNIAPYLDIQANHSYEIPPYYGAETLCLAVSFSGKTEETISAATLAHKKGCSVIGMGIPTKLKELCTRLQIPHVDFPEKFQPTRIGPAFVTLTPAGILRKLGILQITQEEISETVEACRKIRESCSADVPKQKNPAMKIAGDLKGLPIAVYVPSEISGLGEVFKDNFAENSKVFVKWEILPEGNHHDFSIWEDRPKAAAVILRSPKDENEREKISLALSEKVLKKYANKFVKITLPDTKSRVARIFAGLYFGMFVSYYLRTLSGKGKKSVEKTPLQNAVKGKLSADFVERIISSATPQPQAAQGEVPTLASLSKTAMQKPQA